MAESLVLTGLIAKRAELAGQIELAQSKLRQLGADIAQRAMAERG